MRTRFSLLFTVCLGCLSVFVFAAANWPNDRKDNERSFIDINRDIKSFIKRCREAEHDADKVDAIVDMCRLHHEIVNDSRYGRIRELSGMRSKLSHRLKTELKILERAVKKRSESKPKASLNDSSKKKAGADSGATTETNFADLRIELVDRNAVSPEEELRAGSYTDDELVRALAGQMATFVQSTGGPSQLGLYSGSFAGPDYGDELVALIQDTINPEYWSTNGGPGRIHYYSPLRIIVVSASSVMHDDVGNALRNLREMNR